MKGKKEKPSNFILLHPKPQAFRHAKRGELVGGGTPWG